MTQRYTRLERQAIRRLRPGQKINEHGITVERRADGDLRWSVAIMVDGERVHRVIGRDSEGVTRAQCEAFIEAKRTEAREGRLSLPKGRKTAIGFSKAADDYVKRLEETGGKNIDRKRRHLDQHLKPFFGDQRLDAITTFTVDRYKRKRTAAGAANATVNRELATLSHLLNRAVEWKWIRAKGCRIGKLEEAPGRKITLTDEEADALMKAALADSDTYCYLFVAFGLNTAMRHSEILSSRYDNLDLDNLRLFIPKAKAGQREQPITQELADLLKREREMAADPDGWIFPSLRSDLSEVGHRTRMDRPFRRAVIAAGLDPKEITPHVMRHTAITRLIESGVDIPTVQRISGHKTVAMVMRYTHVRGPHINAAMKALGRTIPDRNRNGKAGRITPKLHTVA